MRLYPPSGSGRVRALGMGIALLLGATNASYAQALAPAQSDASSKFYLNYDVPESPAFAALGETPANVLRGTASKPLVLSVLGGLAHGDRLQSGVGLDVAPYAYFGRFRSVSEYQRSSGKRLAANTLVSFGAVQDKQDTASLRAAIGLRLTLRDDHDLLQDSLLARDIAALLVPKKIECPKIGDTNICQKGTSDTELPIDLSSAYDSARARVGTKVGWGVALGVATAARLGGGFLRSDSLGQQTGLGWASATRYLGAGQQLFGTVQWAHDTSGTDHLIGGIAYRYQTALSSLAAELAYDSKQGGILPGLNAEVRLLQRATVVIALLKGPVASGTGPTPLTFRTSVRWAATEGF